MGQLPFWHSVELSSGSRPILRENELDILVENNVGLYQGKSKILRRQDGRVYLTSQRLIYIDNLNSKERSLSIELSDVDKIEYTSKFLKSSPKILIFFKQLNNNNNSNNVKIPKVPWICPICSFSNIVSRSINLRDPQSLPVCENCGIKSTLDAVKSAVSQNSKLPLAIESTVVSSTQIQCPKCTFLNHLYLRNCELCASLLPINDKNAQFETFDDRIAIKTESFDGLGPDIQPFIKLSFHENGDRLFFKKLKEILEKNEWENLVNNGKVNQNSIKLSELNDEPTTFTLGIHSLAKIQTEQLMQNEEIIDSSIDDLQTLVSKANEILKLTESFKALIPDQFLSLNEVTKDVFKTSASNAFYTEEISRQISEFLINDRILNEQGGIISLLDLYFLYNRGRIGIDLISPQDFFDSCKCFKKLNLPLVVKKINNIFVIQDLKYSNDSMIIKNVKTFIKKFGDGSTYKFSNILKISDYFNWSLTITNEFLKVGVSLGELVIDQQISGIFYYLNEFTSDLNKSSTTEMPQTGINPNELLPGRLVSNEVNYRDLRTDVLIEDILPVAPTSKPSILKDKVCYKKTEQSDSTLKQLEGLQF